MENNFLTTEELSKRWGYSVNTLNQWRSDGKGPEYIKFKGVKYRLEAVEAYEKERGLV
jgi:hypothetical protein